MRKKILTCIIVSVLFSVLCLASATAAKETKYTLTNEMDRIKTVHDHNVI